MEGTHLNIPKAMYNKPTVIIILSEEKLKIYPLKSGRKQVCLLSPFFSSVVLEKLAKAKEKKVRE